MVRSQLLISLILLRNPNRNNMEDKDYYTEKNERVNHDLRYSFWTAVVLIVLGFLAYLFL